MSGASEFSFTDPAHVAYHPGDAAVLRGGAIGASQELLAFGQMPITRPNLLPGYDQMVAVNLGRRPQAGQV